MSSALWRLDGVTLDGAAVPRLSGVSLEIAAGTTAILGSSGAGKTSLLNLLVGYERPDEGRIVASVPRDSHSLPAYWVPQGGGLWPHLSAREHVELVTPRSADRSQALSTLDAFDLADKMDSRPDELSCGERSRLAVARALMADAAVLVMDEPFVNVDLARVGRYWGVVRERIAASGASLVFATHSPEAVLAEAERVVCLKEGRLIYEGGVADLYWRPRTREEADCLGENNWLTPDEARLWLGRDEEKPRCLRPEQVVVEAADSSAIAVKSSRFKGSVAETELLHEGPEASGLRPALRTRRFVHRPVADGLEVGMRVVLRVLVCAMLAVLAGCGGSDDPQLKFSEIRSWMLPPDGTSLPAPRALAIGYNDELLAVDTAGRIIVYDANGEFLRDWRMPDTSIGKPEGICVLRDGRIAVADTHYHRVVFFDQQGKLLDTLGSEGKGPGQFIYPVALTQDDAGNLYVAEYGGNDRVQVFGPDGEFLRAFGTFGTGPEQFQRPSGVALCGRWVYVADAINNRILVFLHNGRPIGELLQMRQEHLALQFPYGVSPFGTGSPTDCGVYVIEYGAGRLSKLTVTRIFSSERPTVIPFRFGSTGRGEGEFLTPWGVAVDSKGRVFVADTGNRRIVRLTP